MRARLVPAAALVAALALSGCNDDGGASAKDPDTPTSQGSTSEATADAADGPVLERPGFAVHAPDGWELDEAFSNDTIVQAKSSAMFPAQISVGIVPKTVGSLDDVAASSLESLRGQSPKARRLADGELGGEAAYHLGGPVPSMGRVEEYGLVHGTDQVYIQFQLGGSAAERRAVIDAVLASWEWK